LRKAARRGHEGELGTLREDVAESIPRRLRLSTGVRRGLSIEVEVSEVRRGLKDLRLAKTDPGEEIYEVPFVELRRTLERFHHRPRAGARFFQEFQALGSEEVRDQKRFRGGS
jgi:hypothetical protein